MRIGFRRRRTGGGGGGGNSPEAQFNGILHLNGTLFTQPTALLLRRTRYTALTLPPSPPLRLFSYLYYAFTVPDDTSCGYYPVCRPVPVSFPAVMPPTNRYQMGKIELVRATLVIIAWPPRLDRSATVLPLVLPRSRSYHFRPTYRARTGPRW